MIKKITKCRICGNKRLIEILDLGQLSCAGTFLKNPKQQVMSGPLSLVKCHNETKTTACGLIQLAHRYNLNQAFYNQYGYRSGINKAMKTHLGKKANKLLRLAQPKKGDLLIDIGSNDGTFLHACQKMRPHLKLIGIDPAAKLLMKSIPKKAKIFNTKFSSSLIKGHFKNKKAKIITSIAVFNSIVSPLQFMRSVKKLLAKDGLWLLEQGHLSAMLKNCAYDSICHEHQNYFSFSTLYWLSKKCGLKIVDIEENKINGGSLSIIMAQLDGEYKEASKKIKNYLTREKNEKLDQLLTWRNFKKLVYQHRKKLKALLNQLKKKHKKVIGYGASTKGNVLLQFCNLTSDEIPYIAEINQDKFGCLTPQTHIPIIPEQELAKLKADAYLILPWHFRDNFIQKEKKFLSRGGSLIFPLPSVEVYSK